VETALHQLVVWVEKALDHQETALGVFLDTEEAFNNTCCNTTCDALVRHGGDYTTVWWIRSILVGRMVAATLNDSSVRVAVTRGCPQGVCCHHFCGALWWMIL
jgi:sugar/nucleoside kinase (ribokinase family)